MNILYILCSEINKSVKSRYFSVALSPVARCKMHTIVTTLHQRVDYPV